MKRVLDALRSARFGVFVVLGALCSFIGVVATGCGDFDGLLLLIPGAMMLWTAAEEWERA